MRDVQNHSWCLGVLVVITSLFSQELVSRGNLTLNGGASICAFLSVNGSPYAVCGDSVLSIVSMRYPDNPSLVSTFTLREGRVRDIQTRSSVVYVAAGELGFLMLYAHNPAGPANAGEIRMIGNVSAVALGDTFCAIYHYPSMSLVDPRKPEGPRLRGSVPIHGLSCDIAYSGRHVLVTNRTRVIVVNANNPDACVKVDSVPLPDTARQIEIAGDRAYIGMAGGNVRVIDLSKLPKIDTVGTIIGSGRLACIGLGNGRLYVANTDGALRMHSIGASGLPAGSYITQLTFHATDIAVNDSMLYIGSTSQVTAYSVGASAAVRKVDRGLPAKGFSARDEFNCKGQRLTLPNRHDGHSRVVVSSQSRKVLLD